MVGLALAQHQTGDYASPTCAPDPTCDDAQPAITALAHGHMHEFFARQPLMGSFSLVLRAPFAAAADRIAGGALSEYRAGVIACLLVAALVALALTRLPLLAGRPPWYRALVALALLVNPFVFRALHFGHPEELVAAALLSAAVLALFAGRPQLAGVFAGLAVATKLWAVLALPLLFAGTPAGRRALAFAWPCAAVAAALVVPMALGSPHRFDTITHALRSLGTRPGTVSAPNVWWPYAHAANFHIPARQPDGSIRLLFATGFRLSAATAHLARAMQALAAITVAALWFVLGSRRPRERLLLALALVLLLRALLDFGAFSYYQTPFFVALLAYEAVARRRFAWITAAATIGFVVLLEATRHAALGTLHDAYLAWACPVAALLVLELVVVVPARPSNLE